jgi:hypothetical protein
LNWPKAKLPTGYGLPGVCSVANEQLGAVASEHTGGLFTGNASKLGGPDGVKTLTPSSFVPGTVVALPRQDDVERSGSATDSPPSTGTKSAEASGASHSPSGAYWSYAAEPGSSGR